MIENATRLLRQVELSPATREDQAILENLLQLYAHDFSEFHRVDLGSDGRFVYTNLPLYWGEPERHPFLVRADGRLAGFVLVKKRSEISGNTDVWDMAEFFVIRGCRRDGIGTRIAHTVWTRFPGPWEIRVMHSNGPARRFWESAISAFLDREIGPTTFEKDGELWNLFSFDSNKTPVARDQILIVSGYQFTE